MTLCLSKKLYETTNYFEQDYQIAFRQEKNKLSLKKPEKAKGCLCNLEEIIKIINTLNLPIFDQIDPYLNLRAKLKAFNAERNSTEQKVNIQKFDAHFQPTKEELKEKVWVIYTSSQQAEDEIIYPSMDSTAPFSFTCSFTLGTSKNHIKKEHEFAIAAPLGTILDQAVNLFAHHTFIKGPWKIPPQAVIIFPSYEEDNLTKISKNKATVMYTEDTSLQEAINETLRLKNALPVQLRSSSTASAKAYVQNDLNINTPIFFHELLKENPNLSFGTAFHSSVGTASFLYQLQEWGKEIDCCMNISIKGLPFSHQQELAFKFSILQLKLKQKNSFHFSRKERESIEAWLQKVRSYLKPAKISLKLDFKSHHGVFAANLSLKELEMLKELSAYLFVNYNKYEFEAQWAMSRWLVVGPEQATKENLPAIYKDNIRALCETEIDSFSPHFFEFLIDHLDEDSAHCKEALSILNLDETREYNRLISVDSKRAFLYDNYKAKSIKDVLDSHIGLNRFLDRVKKANLLKFKRNMLIFLEKYPNATQSFKKQYMSSIYKHGTISEEIQQFKDKDLQVFRLLNAFRSHPIETNAAHLNKSLAKTLDALRILKDENHLIELVADMPFNRVNLFFNYGLTPETFWQKLGLFDIYKKLFDTDEEFFDSKESLLEIYQTLLFMQKADKQFLYELPLLARYTHEELKGVKQGNREFFKHFSTKQIQALWALNRWLLIGQAEAEQEKLPKIFERAMTLFLENKEPNFYFHSFVLLNKCSYRKYPEYKTAQRILKLKIFQTYVERYQEALDRRNQKSIC